MEVKSIHFAAYPQIQNDHLSSVMVDARGKSMPKYNSMLQEYREFDGKDTVLIYSRTYKLSFVCDFDHHYYPFDKVLENKETWPGLWNEKLITTSNCEY